MKSRTLRVLLYQVIEDLQGAVVHILLGVDPTERIGEIRLVPHFFNCALRHFQGFVQIAAGLTEKKGEVVQDGRVSRLKLDRATVVLNRLLLSA